MNLYKYVWPVNLPHATLAVIGLLQPYGSISPLSELQSRWAARVFAGAVRLPPLPAQLADIDAKRAAMRARYVSSQRHTLQCDFIDMMDDLAVEIDVKPDLRRVLLADPLLWMQLVFGPTYSYVYRLRGPHKWDGARDAIVTARERIIAPVHNRRVEIPRVSSKRNPTILRLQHKQSSWPGLLRFWAVKAGFYTLTIVAFTLLYFFFGHVCGYHSPLLFTLLAAVTFVAMSTFTFVMHVMNDHSSIIG